jgi:predicted ChrR family anti-sigma factor
MSKRSPHDDATVRALYALGCLPADEAAALEGHLASCRACRDEMRQIEEAASALAQLVPEANPPRELKARLLERVAAMAREANQEAAPARPAQSWKNWAPSSTTGPIFVEAGDTGWEPTGVSGVSVKPLFVDPEHDRVTMLVRMVPGTTYPAHRHGGPEECFLLEGDLDDGDVCMHPGDYLRKDGGTLHGVQSTKDGCLMLIVSSLHDELVAHA